MNFQEIYQMYDYCSRMVRDLADSKEDFYVRNEFFWLRYIYERILNGYFEEF